MIERRMEEAGREGSVEVSASERELENVTGFEGRTNDWELENVTGFKARMNDGKLKNVTSSKTKFSSLVLYIQLNVVYILSTRFILLKRFTWLPRKCFISSVILNFSTGISFV